MISKIADGRYSLIQISELIQIKFLLFFMYFTFLIRRSSFLEPCDVESKLIRFTLSKLLQLLFLFTRFIKLKYLLLLFQLLVILFFDFLYLVFNFLLDLFIWEVKLLGESFFWRAVHQFDCLNISLKIIL